MFKFIGIAAPGVISPVLMVRGLKSEDMSWFILFEFFNWLEDDAAFK